MNAQPLININRFETLVTEIQKEDLSGPATQGVLRLLAANVDTAFLLIQTSLIRLDDKIDGVELRLGARIDGVEQKLDAKIDHLEEKLTTRIDGVEQKLDAKIDHLEEKLTTRIDEVEQKLDAKIDHLEEKLTTRIDEVEHKLGARIDGVALTLRAEMATNQSIIMDQFAQRTNSDRFIKVGFGLAVFGILFQTALQVGLAAIG